MSSIHNEVCSRDLLNHAGCRGMLPVVSHDQTSGLYDMAAAMLVQGSFCQVSLVRVTWFDSHRLP